MPLFEFLRLARGKLESAKQKPPCTSDLSPVPENELVELVWENGQIMMQGQYDRAKKSPDLNDFPSETPGFQDKYTGCAATPKVGKFGLVESILNDAPPSVPSGEIYANQEDEMVPWLDYSIDDNFKQNLGSEILPEISGVTGNGPSSHTCFTSMGNENCNEMFQHSHTVPVHNAVNLEEQNASKVSSSRTGSLSPNSSQRCQISVPSTGSEVSNIFMNTASNSRDAFLGDSIQDQASIGGFISMKMQKQKIGLSDSRCNLLNFSHFSRPAALFRANLEKTDGLAASHLSGIEKTGNEKVPAASSSTPIKSTKVKPSNKTRKEICLHNRPELSSTKVDSRPPVVKPLEESCSAEQADALHWEDSITNDKSPNPVIGAGTTKEVTEGENPVEPVVAASSVCSGNSGEGASSDQMHNLKRKQREYDESESQSEEIEEESVGIKKAAHARGVSGSKRSRAAEVHNLSERRRRDRINEKMRALQELIPNCNKADKASMLDEAIEYLKMLQFQVQMMSMGAGLCMPPMMYPTGLQHMHTAHMPHFSPLGGGMGMGMGYGMGMLMSSASPRFPIFPVPPMHGAHFPSPPLSGSPTFQGMAGSNLQVFGHPGQGLPMSVPRAPVVPFVGQAPIISAVGLNSSRMGIHVEAPSTPPTFHPDVAAQNKNSQLIHNADISNSINQTSSKLQATKKDFDQSAMTSKRDQAPNVCAAAAINLTNTTDVKSTKEVGSD